MCDEDDILGAIESFSALQRAENSSIYFRERDGRTAESGFSALQRAENSSIGRGRSCTRGG